MNRHIRSGNGWRLGWNPTAAEFTGLVAGDTWAVELTPSELNDFCRLARQLGKTMTDMASQLMDEERLTCEQETTTVWLEADGFPQSFGLRFILLTGRKSEGEWPADAAKELLAALSSRPFSEIGNEY